MTQPQLHNKYIISTKLIRNVYYIILLFFDKDSNTYPSPTSTWHPFMEGKKWPISPVWRPLSPQGCHSPNNELFIISKTKKAHLGISQSL